MRIKPGGIRAGVEVRISDVYHPVTGNVATDGVVYSTVATIGTTAVEVFNALIDPGVTVGLSELEVGLTQRFAGLNGSVSGSLSYFWQVRSEADIIGSGPQLVKFTGAWVSVWPTLSKLIGTSVAYEDTLSGYAALASLPYAPVRISLNARSLAAANAEGKVKNSLYIALKGIAIPGT